MFIRKTLASLAILVTAAAANATPVTINFDDLSANVVIGAAYAHLGVNFTNAQTAEFNLLGGTAPNSVGSISDGYQPQPSNPISAIFSAPVASVQLTGLDVGTNGFTLSAYDAAVGGNIVDTATVYGSGLGVDDFFTLEVAGANIFRIEFSQAAFLSFSDGLVFDNLVFDIGDVEEVPEPSSIALLALGLAGCVFGRRRNAKRT